MMHKNIKNIPKDERPRERLQQKKEDIEITKQLKSAGETLGIRLLDHIIFNHKEYYSFLEKGEFNAV